jgi:tripartite-type tricarboxylate transporter receptor subunit TctC
MRFMLRVLLLLCVFWAEAASAQAWPTRPVTIIVPYQPGIPVDAVARLLADRLSAALNQPFVIDNRAGATGIIGSSAVMRAAPDGYTLLVATNASHVIQPIVKAPPPYDALRDFTPVAKLVDAPLFLTVNPDVPAKNVAELVALAKREPGKLNYGSSGPGSYGNFVTELFKATAGVDIVHVPFKGSATAVTDLIAGRIQVMVDAATLPAAKSGRLRLLATTAGTRFPDLPDVPTFREAGIPFEAVGWFGLFAPPNLPPALATQISQAVRQVLAQPEVQRTLVNNALSAAYLEPAAFRSVIADDLKRYRTIRDTARIEAE